jgi:hypothetical protein
VDFKIPIATCAVVVSLWPVTSYVGVRHANAHPWPITIMAQSLRVLPQVNGIDAVVQHERLTVIHKSVSLTVGGLLDSIRW